VNTGAMPLYINVSNTSDDQMYEADYIILRTMDAKKMTYFAPPHFSFEYELSGDYYPGENILGDYYVREYAMKFFFHGQTEVEGIKNNVLLKIYNDACAKRPYAVTTPRSPQGQNNIYKNLKSTKTGEKLYRSCLHPIQSEYLEGIGLYKEFYEEDGKVYTSKLISIDNVPIQQYLKLNAQTIKWANEAKVQNTISEIEPTKIDIPNEYSGEETVFGFAHKGIKDDKIQPLVQEFIIPSVDKAKEPKPLKSGIIHTVEKGETLYRLAKQYNTTVEKLKDLNELNDNTIVVNQELLIRQAD
jgi:LysM repeat protein